MRLKPLGLIVSLGLLNGALAADAQQPGKVHRVGFVFTSAPVSEMMGPDPVHPLARSFLHGLQALGYVQGRNLVFEPRSAEGKFERFREILEELVSLRVDVLVVAGNDLTQRAKEVTTGRGRRSASLSRPSHEQVTDFPRWASNLFD